MKRTLLIITVVAVMFSIASCGNSEGDLQVRDDAKVSFDCNGDYISIVTTVSQWASLVNEYVNTPTSDGYGRCYKTDVIISSTESNPHNFEPTATDIDKLQKANIAVLNGLGYDDWALKYLPEDVSKIVIGNMLTVVDEEGNPSYSTDSSNNVHLWYSYDAIRYAITQLNNYIYNPDVYMKLEEQVTELTNHIALSQNYTSGKKFIATESVANLLLRDMQLINETPERYINTTESNDDIELLSADLEAMDDLIPNVDFIVENMQAVDDSTRQIVEIAKKMNVKVVQVYEQLPDGTNLIEYLQSIVSQFL